MIIPKTKFNKTTTAFRVKLTDSVIGQATLSGNCVRFKTQESAFPMLENQPHAFIAELRSIVRRLVRSTGHWGKYYATEDIDSGISVERL